MIRPFTIVTMLLAAGSGLYLYQAKQKVRVLDRQISDIRAGTDATRQRAEVLRAEYTLLNDPTRLAELVSAHLPDLRPTQPAQWTSMAELDKRLPPVGDGVTPPPPGEVPSPPVAAAEPAHPLPAAPPPAVVARATPPHPIVALVREAPPAPVARPPVRIAASVAPLAPRTTPRAAAAPGVPTTQVLATLHAAPAAAASGTTPMVASALGMARAMMTPVAVTPADAATLPVPVGVPPR
jgi:hypothetical protein